MSQSNCPLICFCLFTIIFIQWMVSYMYSLPNVSDDYMVSTIIQSCNGNFLSSMKICDPNSLLKDDQRDHISQAIIVMENDYYSIVMKDDDNNNNNNNNNHVGQLEMAIVVIDQLVEPKLSSPIVTTMEEGKCQYIAEKLLDSWINTSTITISTSSMTNTTNITSIIDINNNSTDTNYHNINTNSNINNKDNGEKILLLLSRFEKSICMVGTKNINKILTENRIDEIMNNVNSKFGWSMSSWKNDDLYDGIIYCINRISQYIYQGEPSFWDKYGWFCFIFFYVVLRYYLDENTRIRRSNNNNNNNNSLQLSSTTEPYVEKEMDEKEHTEATLLMNKYECYSCPICLENFQCNTIANHDEEEGSSRTMDVEISSLMGSDGEPIKLLRCGHSSCQNCWDEWVSAGKQNGKCPVCMQYI